MSVFGPFLRRGLTRPGFCGDLVCGFGKVVGGAGFSDRFWRIIIRWCVGCRFDVMRQYWYLVYNLITVNGYVSLFNCMTVGQASALWWLRLGGFILVCWGRDSFVCYLVHRCSTGGLLLLQISGGVVWRTRGLLLSLSTLCL